MTSTVRRVRALSELRRGAMIEARAGGTVVRGTVYDAAPGIGVVWVQLAPNRRRALQAEDYSLWHVLDAPVEAGRAAGTPSSRPHRPAQAPCAVRSTTSACAAASRIWAMALRTASMLGSPLRSVRTSPAGPVMRSR